MALERERGAARQTSVARATHVNFTVGILPLTVCYIQRLPFEY